MADGPDIERELREIKQRLARIEESLPPGGTFVVLSKIDSLREDLRSIARFTEILHGMLSDIKHRLGIL